MFDKILLMQGGGFYGGDVGLILARWEQMGFFSYVLPFLLIFCLVFGILTKVKVFDNKAINGVLALVVGLLALQFNVVPLFFSEIFPRVGIGLSVILALIILVGLFFDPDNKYQNYALLGGGVVIFIVVLVQTFGWFGTYPGWWWYHNLPQILGIVLFLVIIGLIIGSGNQKKVLADQNPLIFSSFPRAK